MNVRKSMLFVLLCNFSVLQSCENNSEKEQIKSDLVRLEAYFFARWLDGGLPENAELLEANKEIVEYHELESGEGRNNGLVIKDGLVVDVYKQPYRIKVMSDSTRIWSTGGNKVDDKGEGDDIIRIFSFGSIPPSEVN